MPRIYRKRKTNVRNTLGVQKKKAVKKLIKSAFKQQLEGHYYPAQLNDQATSTTTFIHMLSSIPQGTTDVTRIGDEVVLDKISLDMVLRLPLAASTATLCQTRIFIVQIHYQFDGGSPPAWNAFMSSSANPNFLTSYMLPDIENEFTIIYDKTFLFDLATQGGKSSYHIKKKLKGFRKRIQYVAASASNGIHNLYLYALSTIDTNAPLLTCTAMLEWLQ